MSVYEDIREVSREAAVSLMTSGEGWELIATHVLFSKGDFLSASRSEIVYVVGRPLRHEHPKPRPVKPS